MANYTPNYRLHQWEPEDKFLRTDFNEDFAAIDAALGKTERDARRAAAGLERQGSDLYNLLLQTGYEGKTTGWKRALVFDGFQDGAGIAQKDEALILGRNCLSLHRTGLSSIDLGYGGDGSYCMETRNVTCTSGGRVSAMTVRLCNGASFSDSLDMTCALTCNGTALFSGHRCSSPKISSGSYYDERIDFPGTYVVKQGDVLKFSIQSSATRWKLVQDRSDSGLGGVFHAVPLAAASGRMTSAPWTVPAAEGALAWVRHSGGAVSLTLTDGAGEHPLLPDGQRQTVEPGEGRACTESAFRLTGPLAAGPLTAALEVRCEDSPIVHVYDYGILLL